MIVTVTQDGDTIMSGYFSMAARDPVTFKSKEIPKIKVTSPEEEIIFKAAQGFNSLLLGQFLIVWPP